AEILAYETSYPSRAHPSLARPGRARAALDCRAAAFPSHPSELRGPEGGSRVLPEAVRENGDEDDLQRLRGGEDRQRLCPLHQGQHAADQRAHRTANLHLALRLEHARLAQVR